MILLKAQITRKKINLPKLIWLNSKTVKIYSVVQSVKFLLALSIHELGILSGITPLHRSPRIAMQMVIHSVFFLSLTKINV